MPPGQHLGAGSPIEQFFALNGPRMCVHHQLLDVLMVRHQQSCHPSHWRYNIDQRQASLVGVSDLGGRFKDQLTFMASVKRYENVRRRFNIGFFLNGDTEMKCKSRAFGVATVMKVRFAGFGPYWMLGYHGMASTSVSAVKAAVPIGVVDEARESLAVRTRISTTKRSH